MGYVRDRWGAFGIDMWFVSWQMQALMKVSDNDEELVAGNDEWVGGEWGNEGRLGGWC